MIKISNDIKVFIDKKIIGACQKMLLLKNEENIYPAYLEISRLVLYEIEILKNFIDYEKFKEKIKDIPFTFIMKTLGPEKFSRITKIEYCYFVKEPILIKTSNVILCDSEILKVSKVTYTKENNK